MIRINVTNKDNQTRDWFVEPYGDHMTLEPGDVMTIEFEHPAELIIDITLHECGGEEIWTHGATRYEVLLPKDLKLNGTSVWPQPQDNG
ncbi:hypothetical protein [Nocardia lijiangensis]|uniref:hypothetical protein n=1 Tax=Nocardia lijiangensis TaxID=299618 RepID=UPI00082D1359|nr:hypothetical protein [Nocardia lijiangensis]